MAVPAQQLRARQNPRPVGQPQRRPPVRALAPRPRRTRRQDRRRRTIGILCVLLTVGSLLAVVGAHAYLTQGQLRLTQLQGQLNSQLARHRDLQLQVANLEQPASVLSEAQKQGLVVPANVNDLPQVNLTAPSPSSAGASASSASSTHEQTPPVASGASADGSQVASRSGGQ